MRIDTKKLRKLINSNPSYIGTSKKCLEAADELDRLYAIEDATTPFKDRAELEAYLKGKGLASVDNEICGHEWESREIETHEYRGATIIDEPDGSFTISLTYDKGISNPLRMCFRLTATPALRDAIVEAK